MKLWAIICTNCWLLVEILGILKNVCWSIYYEMLGISKLICWSVYLKLFCWAFQKLIVCRFTMKCWGCILGRPRPTGSHFEDFGILLTASLTSVQWRRSYKRSTIKANTDILKILNNDSSMATSWSEESLIQVLENDYINRCPFKGQ